MTVWEVVGHAEGKTGLYGHCRGNVEEEALEWARMRWGAHVELVELDSVLVNSAALERMRDAVLGKSLADDEWERAVKGAEG